MLPLGATVVVNIPAAVVAFWTAAKFDGPGLVALPLRAIIVQVWVACQKALVLLTSSLQTSTVVPPRYVFAPVKITSLPAATPRVKAPSPLITPSTWKCAAVPVPPALIRGLAPGNNMMLFDAITVVAVASVV